MFLFVFLLCCVVYIFVALFIKILLIQITCVHFIVCCVVDANKGCCKLCKLNSLNCLCVFRFTYEMLNTFIFCVLLCCLYLCFVVLQILKIQNNPCVPFMLCCVVYICVLLFQITCVPFMLCCL